MCVCVCVYVDVPRCLLTSHKATPEIYLTSKPVRSSSPPLRYLESDSTENEKYVEREGERRLIECSAVPASAY